MREKWLKDNMNNKGQLHSIMLIPTNLYTTKPKPNKTEMSKKNKKMAVTARE